MAFQISLSPSGHQYHADATTTLLEAALAAGFTLPYGCRNGACGSCKGKVLAGEIDHGKAQQNVLTIDERANGMALFCCATPRSDLVLECREVGNANDIPVRILPCRVQKIERVAEDVIILSLKLPTNERLQFLPGQYIEFLLKDGKRRAFSIANAPHSDDFVTVHIRRVDGGAFTAHVFETMKEKEILRFNGPLGSFYLREESNKPIIFVAGGTGFAPIKSIIEHALHHGEKRQMHFYWGAQNRAGLYLPELPASWPIDYVPVLSHASAADQWHGRTGFVHQAALADHPDLSEFQVYACGSPGMIDATRLDFIAAGLPEQEFFSDAFSLAPPGS
jgi:CDP-4-dehydro-6-deoxyglucose reductase